MFFLTLELHNPFTVFVLDAILKTLSFEMLSICLESQAGALANFKLFRWLQLKR